MRHIGIQYNGYLTPDTLEPKMHGDNHVNRNQEIPKYPMRSVNELDDLVIPGPVSVDRFPFPSGVQPREQVTYLYISLVLMKGKEYIFSMSHFISLYALHTGLHLCWILCSSAAHVCSLYYIGSAMFIARC